MTDALTPAATQVVNELTPKLRSYAKEFGLRSDLADSLSLVWDGTTFLAVSPLSLDDAEYGDGIKPAPRPVHKAMNRLEADAEELLTRLVREAADNTVVRF